MSLPLLPTARSRRRLLAAALAAPLAATWVRIGRAQDAPAPIVPVAPQNATIIATGRGEVPTFGGRRPGPFDRPAPGDERARGIAPVGVRIDAIGVDAGIERLQVVDGAMQDPTGPFTVGWYENLGAIGGGDNVVLAGHIDYWNVGPAVFYNLAGLQPGDEVLLAGEDGGDYAYAVESVQQYDAENAPLDEIVGSDGQDSVTLITCGGTFDYQNGYYLQRTVVRARSATT